MRPEDVVPDEEREVDLVVDDQDPGAQNPPVDPEPESSPEPLEGVPEAERPV
jgi:hypothetical protein